MCILCGNQQQNISPSPPTLYRNLPFILCAVSTVPMMRFFFSSFQRNVKLHRLDGSFGNSDKGIIIFISLIPLGARNLCANWEIDRVSERERKERRGRMRKRE